jgi:hypothetical protein
MGKVTAVPNMQKLRLCRHDHRRRRFYICMNCGSILTEAILVNEINFTELADGTSIRVVQVVMVPTRGQNYATSTHTSMQGRARLKSARSAGRFGASRSNRMLSYGPSGSSAPFSSIALCGIGRPRSSPRRRCTSRSGRRRPHDTFLWMLRTICRAGSSSWGRPRCDSL